MGNNFVFALNEQDIKPNSMKLVNISDKQILLARYENEFYAVSNKCPHMGCSLANGELKGYFVICPCNAWKFDLRNGQYVITKNITLTIYECKMENGKIFINVPTGI